MPIPFRLFVALVLMLLAGMARAGSFQVNPIRVDLSAALPSQSLVVKNDGAETLVIQMSVHAWTQQDGTEVYAATQEALVTPPIAQIAPGAEQVIRVGLRRAPDPGRQLTYRLFVNEVPSPPAPGFGGLQVALRVGIPVFVAPAGAVRRDVSWTVSPSEDGALRLRAENRGNAHLQLLGFTLHADGHTEPVAQQQQLAYVLAGQAREWTLPARWPPGTSMPALRLSAFTDAGEIHAVVAPEP